MASDYDAIRACNERLYGTDVGRYGKSLLTDLYDDRTHFIYELLQNAEDALRRRNDEPQSRTVRFELSEYALRVSHYGKLFDRQDVESICGIALSTTGEDLTRIGRFGIGFKSVYGFTDRPEIHSGDEDFGIGQLRLAVGPTGHRNVTRTRPSSSCRYATPMNTVRKSPMGFDALALTHAAISYAEIETIEWSLPDGTSGTYVRGSDTRDNHVRRVTVIGESTDQGDTERSWQVFSRSQHAGLVTCWQGT